MKQKKNRIPYVILILFLSIDPLWSLRPCLDRQSWQPKTSSQFRWPGRQYQCTVNYLDKPSHNLDIRTKYVHGGLSTQEAACLNRYKDS